MQIHNSKQQKKSQGAKCNVSRLLISINVMGSAGPIRFVVTEDELVGSVIDTALRAYARQGRLPVLGSDPGNFLLYCANAESDALSPWETIGSQGARNFLLWKKQKAEEGNKGSPPAAIGRKGSGRWKAWINKSLSLKIPSH
ncbi:hypothetical protein BT93_G1373 [Corymbia citriodora subsp. variegata]|nr:hypothetical protein BT93_G1373 [Corymbia citriodora subsp. variegata]